MSVQTGTITTQVPSRLDRLPWSRFHKMVVVGLGGVWILDGLEVTMVGSVAARMIEPGGFAINAGQIGTAGAIYVIGACLGALFFGQLTDKYGRKKLFLLTLSLYILATVATGFSMSVWWFFATRFFTGAGIGGEYAAINSAIDELIPARVRGRVDLTINGSYWLGSALGAAVAILLLHELAGDWGWRTAFFVGAILGVTILVVRRHVPESPRWLFIHGRQEEAERIVGDIERGIQEETGEDLPEPQDKLTVRQREHIPFTEIAKVAFKLYPKRAILGLSLFIGQAFIYNGVTFNLGTLYSTFYGVAAAFVPVFIIIWALGNFAGPVTLGRLFDTVGRKPMISSTYIGSAIVVVILAQVFVHDVMGPWLFLAVLVVAFFLASAGASAAYLTVSEIFPMETRALAIAFFYAIGTAIGGISGPLLFGHFINSGDRGLVAIAFYIGAVVMALGGVVELFFGVKAERATLEDLAMPLTAAEAEGEEEDDSETGHEDESETGRSQHDADGQSDAHGAQTSDHTADTGADQDGEDDESEQDQARHERDQRISTRTERQHRENTTGAARFRPGPGRMFAPRMAVSDTSEPATVLDHEIESIARALADRGTLTERGLHQVVGAQYWGPGRFSRALHQALAEGRAVRLPRDRFAPPKAR